MPAVSVLRSGEITIVEQKEDEDSVLGFDVPIKLQGMRCKRVTDPLNEIVRARLCGNDQVLQILSSGYSSSGSEYEGECVSLGDMVCGFMEEDDEKVVCSRCKCLNDKEDSLSEHEIEEPNSAQILKNLGSFITTAELCVLGHVTHAVDMAKETERFCDGDEEVNESKSCIRRAVMNHLKGLGYNAGICKSRQEQVTGFHAGEYEYIDVIMERSARKDDRIMVDMDFRAQFEVARPTKEYSELVQLLPYVFVGKADRLHHIINIMCAAAKRSLEENTMHIPPWRKYLYMRSKWLGSYRRTTNRVSNPHKAKSFHTIEWRPPCHSANTDSKSTKVSKVSGLATALTQARLSSPIFYQ